MPSPLPEFSQEMSTTRRVLERVPDDRGAWKPHPKSFPLGHLAQLVATMPGWIDATLRRPEIDLAAGAGYSLEPTATLVERFDALVRSAEAALAEVTAERLAETWTLRSGERVLLAIPREAAVRQHLHHLVHHRGQLSVYLRLVDVPVPSIYGPTADEAW